MSNGPPRESTYRGFHVLVKRWDDDLAADAEIVVMFQDGQVWREQRVVANEAQYLVRAIQQYIDHEIWLARRAVEAADPKPSAGAYR